MFLDQCYHQHHHQFQHHFVVQELCLSHIHLHYPSYLQLYEYNAILTQRQYSHLLLDRHLYLLIQNHNLQHYLKMLLLIALHRRCNDTNPQDRHRLDQDIQPGLCLGHHQQVHQYICNLLYSVYLQHQHCIQYHFDLLLSTCLEVVHSIYHA